MGKGVCTLLICIATTSLFCQTSPSAAQVATVTAVSVHQNAEGNPSGVKQYDVSLKVGDTVYVVLYTPPAGANGVEYAPGLDVVVVVGSKTITFTKLGRTSEVPILRRETVPGQAGIDWSRAPSEYFSQKLQNLSEKLDLTSEQQAKIKPFLEQEAGQAREIIANPALSTPDKLNKLEKIVRSSDRKLKPLLTGEQWQALQRMRADQKQQLTEFVANKSNEPKDR
jgi:hypothetical protein